MSRREVAALVLGAVCLWAGCTAFDDATLPVAKGEVTTDGGTSGTTSTSSSSGCPGFAVPNAAPDPALGSGGDIEVVLAVQTISVGLKDGKVSPDFGYNLDNTCNCAPDAGVPRPSCTPRQGGVDGGACDGNLGRDVATSNMLANLGLGSTYDPAKFANESIAAGQRGIVLRIEKYNGTPNDDEIRFSLYRGRPVPKDTEPNFADPAYPWDIDEADLNKGGVATFQGVTVSSGFVTNGLLVVSNLPTSRIPFNNDSDLILKEVKFTGMLKEKDGRWLLDKPIAVGRWNLTDALQTIGRVRSPIPGSAEKRICDEALLINTVRQKVCASADIMDSAQADNSGRVCNSLSAAVEFTTAPAAFKGTFVSVTDGACATAPIPDCD